MTADEWEVSNDVETMLKFVRGRASPRKLRLFAAACCRRLLRHLRSEEGQSAITMAEAMADNTARTANLRRLRHLLPKKTNRGFHTAEHDPAELLTAHASLAAELVVSVGRGSAIRDADHAAYYASAQGRIVAEKKSDAALQAEIAAQSDILRDLFGHLFVDDAMWTDSRTWLVDAVVRKAQILYATTQFHDLRGLGSAIEALGCNNERILAHCRQTPPHYRGCWVVDRLTNRE